MENLVSDVSSNALKMADMGVCSQKRIADFEYAAEILNKQAGDGFYMVERHELVLVRNSLSRQRVSIGATVKADAPLDLGRFWRAVEGLGPDTLVLRSINAVAASLQSESGK